MKEKKFMVLAPNAWTFRRWLQINKVDPQEAIYLSCEESLVGRTQKSNPGLKFIDLGHPNWFHLSNPTSVKNFLNEWAK